MVSLIFTLIIFGLIWWLITTYLPLPQPIKTIITVIFVLILIVWLFQFVGGGGPFLRFPR